MPRSFLNSEYLDDDGVPWRLRVRADYALDPNRGWVTGETPGLPPLPRLWLPRRVVGVDASGRVQHAIIATTSAPLWTGAASSFLFIGNDGATYAATVTGHQGEKRLN